VAFSGDLKVVCQLLLDGKYREANEHYRTKLNDAKFGSHYRFVKLAKS